MDKSKPAKEAQIYASAQVSPIPSTDKLLELPRLKQAQVGLANPILVGEPDPLLKQRPGAASTTQVHTRENDKKILALIDLYKKQKKAAVASPRRDRHYKQHGVFSQERPSIFAPRQGGEESPLQRSLPSSFSRITGSDDFCVSPIPRRQRQQQLKNFLDVQLKWKHDQDEKERKFNKKHFSVIV